ncbi:unnamed protein product [Mytilus edulis]|uniref:WSC domain-containing protein n=1 Tax=Mytilus edulis TaxID=6550 RepID=A0A8S3RZV2_MYTED|nr:unnamed protein product [Mytilus edulis]
MCSLAGIEEINNIDIFNESSGINKVGKAWTGTTVKYTKWAAFIGCGRRYSSIDSGRSTKTIDDCLQYCSGYSTSSYFVIKSSRCWCLSHNPETYDGNNDCRAICTNPSNTPCHYGNSALVFAFVEAQFTRKTWYDYQEDCLKQGNFVLYNNNTLRSYPQTNETYWTPIFRSHTVSSEIAKEKDFCIALSNVETRYFTIEHCSTLLPFLCTKSKSESNIKHYHEMAILTSVIIAAALIIILLIFLMIMISSRALGRLRFYKEKLQKVNERLQGTEFSEYTGLDESNVEGNESGYRELSPRMQQRSTIRQAHTPRDQLDHQECSIFIGFPISNWTTSSEVCSLPKVNNINITDMFINLLENTTFKEADKAWTGTVIKYTKFAAFIGCGRSYSPIDSGKNVETVEDCLRHCSDYSFASYFVIKSSKCFCISDKPEINSDVNDCRTVCTNVSYTPCSSGRSSMVFSFVEDINIPTTNTYIEQECVTVNKGQNRFIVRDCNAHYFYGCRNTSYELISNSWYGYQEKCLKDGWFVLFNRPTISDDANENLVFWTPIFRSHALVSGKHAGTEFCVPSTFCDISCIGIRLYEEQLKQVNERLPGTEFSNYAGIEDSNEEVNNPRYNELSDESSQNNETGFEASKDKVDSQGYLMPEQHYHTILEVEEHYAEANVAEINGDKEHIGNDGYLVPVSK